MDWFSYFVVGAVLVSFVGAVAIFYVSSARPILHASWLREFFHFVIHYHRMKPRVYWHSKGVAFSLAVSACIGALATDDSAASAAKMTNMMSDKTITQQLVGSWTARDDSPEFLSKPNMQSQLGITIVERLAGSGLGSVGAFSNRTCKLIRPPIHFSWTVRAGRLITSQSGKHATEDLVLGITPNFLELYSLDHHYEEYRVRIEGYANTPCKGHLSVE